MPADTEDPDLIAGAFAYVNELYHERAGANVLNLGTQNQLVDFILADPELAAAVRRWAAGRNIAEATTVPPQRLPHDVRYERAHAYLADIIERPVMPAEGPAH